MAAEKVDENVSQNLKTAGHLFCSYQRTKMEFRGEQSNHDSGSGCQFKKEETSLVIDNKRAYFRVLYGNTVL